MAVKKISRFRRIRRDQDVKNIPGAVIRTLINIGISATEFAPFITFLFGDIFSNSVVFSSKIPKLFKWSRGAKFLGLKKLDTTPVVPWKDTKKTLIWRDVPTGGLWMTHTGETLRQLEEQDWPRIKKGFAAIIKIIFDID